AEDDHVRVGRGSLPREPERVADVIGYVLHVGPLVVVREDDRVALPRECAHLVLHRGDHSRTSSETVSERAECVSAPTEMKSTPVSAIDRTVASETPPEASSVARPPAMSTASASRSGLMLSRRMRGTPVASASRTWSSVSASTSTSWLPFSDATAA